MNIWIIELHFIPICLDNWWTITVNYYILYLLFHFCTFISSLNQNNIVDINIIPLCTLYQFIHYVSVSICYHVVCYLQRDNLEKFVDTNSLTEDIYLQVIIRFLLILLLKKSFTKKIQKNELLLISVWGQSLMRISANPQYFLQNISR